MDKAVVDLENKFSYLEDASVNKLEDLVSQAKGIALTLIKDAGSGHPGGTMSIMRSLLMHYIENSDYTAATQLSGGHCVPALYALAYMAGELNDEDMGLFRTINGPSGHADTRVQGVASGLLGHGAGVANGYALAERLTATKEDRPERKTWVFIGDGESDEGNIPEAIEHAITENLNVVYVFMDNGKNLSGDLVHDFEDKVAGWEKMGLTSYGAENSVSSLKSIFGRAKKRDGPVAISVCSSKGDGVSFMEDHESGYHGDPLPQDKYEIAMKELEQEPTTFRTPELEARIEVVRDTRVIKAVEALKEQGFGLTSAATRKANEYLAELGKDHEELFVLIPDIGKSVVMNKFAEAFPERFMDVGIKEMTAALEASGLAASGYLPIVSTFDGFTHIVMPAARMADYSQLRMGFIFTHAELLGEDGPTHLITENLGSWLGLYNIETVGNPADFEQAKAMIKHCVADGEGMFYIRLGRPGVPTIYSNESGCMVPEYGKADILFGNEESKGPVLFTTGQQVWESLIAAEMLKECGLDPSVVNVAYLRPFDEKAIIEEAAGRDVYTIEQHRPETGLGGLVSNTLLTNDVGVKSFTQIGVTGYIPSGSIESQKEYCGLLGEQIHETICDTMK
ncbi:hypothetical protein HOC35_07225 [Candidatus Woesearchaeota archaeon]|jgi:transketolase|nr:hypothetical protein [Candidatus Woesearchaeota archaeon]